MSVGGDGGALTGFGRLGTVYETGQGVSMASW